MKKITLIAIALLSVNFLFAFEKNDEANFMLAKTNSVVLNSNSLLNPDLQITKKRDRGGDAFAQGAIVISAGYGFPNLGKAVMTSLINSGSGSTDIKATGIGPLHFKGEYGLSDKIGFGVSVNYISFGAKWTSYDATGAIPFSNSFNRTSLSVLARLNIHFATSGKLDPYWGIGAGYRSATYTFTTNDPNNASHSAPALSPVGFETTIGLRYYITPLLGLYTEIGIAKSVIQVGLSLKL